MNIIKQLFCKHDYQFVRNIYGDEIRYLGWKRSEWRCSKCGKIKYFNHLKEYYDNELSQNSRKYHKRRIPIGAISDDYVWDIYNFVSKWKTGSYGEVSLRQALRDNFRKEAEK